MTEYRGQMDGVQWTGTGENRTAALLYSGGIVLTDVQAGAAGTVSGFYFFSGFGRNPPGKPFSFFPLGIAARVPFDATLANMSFPLPSIPGFSSSEALSSTTFTDDTNRTITANWSSVDGTYKLHAILSVSSPVFGLASVALPDPAEGNAGTTWHYFDVIREGGLNAASVAWSVLGSGIHPASEDDFVGSMFPSGTAIFAANQTSLRIAIPIAGNSTREPDETYSVRLDVPADDLVVLQTSLTAPIVDDDISPAPSELGVEIGGQRVVVAPSWYAGPVRGIETEIILLDRGDIVLTAYSPNWFLRGGAGMDALAAAGGTNVVDGGGGSNFLSGQGAETYFLDARGLTTSLWSTVVGFEARDAATIWLDDAMGATLNWVNDQGAEGYRGLTLLVDQPGRPLGLLTLPGFSTTDLGSRLHLDRGVTTDSNPYLLIRAEPSAI